MGPYFAGVDLTTDSYLEVNSAILRRRFPALADMVQASEGQLPPSVRAQLSRNGKPTVAIDRPSGPIHVHSLFDPLLEAERWASVHAAQSDGEFAVVVGLGLGYHVELLLERRRYGRLVVIEPKRELFLSAMILKDQRALLSHPGLELLVTDDPLAAAVQLFERHARQLIHNGPLFLWPAASRYAPEFWSAFQQRLVDKVRSTRSNLATVGRFSLQWLDNFFANIETSAADPGIAPLLNRFVGRPAIIVSAGPSLNKNVHLLARAKGRAVIIAAGSAINPLLRNGIEPDLLVSFDPGEANYDHFAGLQTPTLPLVYVPTVFPRILAEYQGPRFTAAMDAFPFTSWAFERIGENKGLLCSGPSVANVSWNLALQMGLDPIILVGQDLAYTDFKSHADGTVHARTVEMDAGGNGGKYFAVEGVNGGLVYTDRPMYAMKLWFEQRISRLRDRMTIDATEGGARIEGTHIMQLREALDRYCGETFCTSETILNIYRWERLRLEAANAEGRVFEIYRALQGHLSAAARIAHRGVKDGTLLLSESKTKRLTQQRYREAVIRLERLLKELAGLPAFRMFVEPVTQHVIQAITLLILERWEKEPKLASRGAQLAQQYLLLFRTVEHVTQHIEKLLTKSTS